MRRILFFLALAPVLLRGETLTIQNEFLRIEYDPATWQFSATDISSDAGPDRIALKDMVSSVGGAPVKSTVQDPIFGNGDELLITDCRGESTKVELFHGLPFAFMRVALTASTSKEEAGMVMPQHDAPVAGFVPDLNAPWSKLVIRGTGGLHAAPEYAPRAHPWLNAIWDKIMRKHYQPLGGSYEWLAVADPETGHGIVAGFLTQDRATGVLTPVVDADGLRVQTRSEFGDLQVRAEVNGGPPYQAEALAFGCFTDVRLGLEAYADALAREHGVHLPPQPAGLTTWYMEKNGGAADEQSLATLSDFIAKYLKPYGMSFVQIDDRWQSGQDMGNGPDKNFTASNPKGPYPSGMKITADHIRANGLVPGLWFLPFSGADNDPWFADKQNLFVKTKDGKPFDTAWGGTCLDMTNPAAQAYAQGIVTNITHNWGFSYLKIDGLYTGLGVNQVYVNSDYNPNDGFGDAVFANPNKTNVEAFRDGLKLVRAAADPDVFILGCNTAQNMRVFGASMGLVDAMRIGPDNARILSGPGNGNVGPPQIEVSWKSWRDASPLYGSREYFLNGRVWYNDPDPNYVRTSLSLDEARTEASWTAISGQLFTSSDWLPDLPAERLDIIKRTIAPHGGTSRPVDFLENDPPRIWQLTDDGYSLPVGIARLPGSAVIARSRRDVIGLFNFDDTQQTITVPLDRLDLPKAGSYAAFDFWPNAFLPVIKDTISATLPPHACQILAVRPMLDHPFIISTSRHVTQGMIDVTNEHWDPTTRTLSGISRVVGGDPYELRIACANAASLRITKATANAPQARPSDLTIALGAQGQAQGGGFRATISSPYDAAGVFWQITFADNL